MMGPYYLANNAHVSLVFLFFPEHSAHVAIPLGFLSCEVLVEHNSFLEAMLLAASAAIDLMEGTNANV